ncbi:MAG: trkA-N domain protein [Bacillales bacterium]|nr:trkA-N domain protein [Bacillales bacterium]
MRNRNLIIMGVINILLISLMGTIGFSIIEDIKWFDALWLTFASILTIGYGDIVPVTTEGRIFALTLVPLGIGVVTYFFSYLAARFIEKIFSKTSWRKRMNKKINSLKEHIIVSGYGRVGEKVVQNLLNNKINVVVIEKNITSFGHEEQPFLYVEGDATDEHTLLEAGIKNASGFITTLPDDAANLLATMSAKDINPSIHIVARAERPESERKLIRAGADRVINPSSLGGERMALTLLKPLTINYFETILHDDNKEFSFGEYKITPDSKVLNLTISESNIRKETGVTIIAIHRNGELIGSPAPSELLRLDDVVIVLGLTEDLSKLENYLLK